MFRSFYIHWPFCPYKCHFCPFVAFAGQDNLMAQYHASLVQEIQTFAQQHPEIQLDTIYFGGGTPSTYPPELLLDMFDTLKKVSVFDKNIEITMEVNPGTVTKQKLQLWEALGINRLSIGVQSLNEKALKDVNRLQTNNDVTIALEYASELFENISVDFIVGLPNVSEQQWKDQLRKAVQWPIKHIAVYFLTIHEFTPLYYRLKKQEVQLPPDEQVVDVYAWTIAYLAEHGFVQYEISNFAREGFQSSHNKAYWNRKPYQGFGVGAWSFDGKRRYRNKKNLALYMQGALENAVQGFQEELTPDQHALEIIMLGLRQTDGLAKRDYYNNIHISKHEYMQQQIEKLKNEGLLYDVSDRLILTVKGYALEHEVIAQIVA